MGRSWLYKKIDVGEDVEKSEKDKRDASQNRTY